jgi:hypothetical protein
MENYVLFRGRRYILVFNVNMETAEEWRLRLLSEAEELLEG